MFVIATFGRIQKLELQHIIMTGLAVADILTLIPYGSVIVTLASSQILLSDEMCKWFGVLGGGACSGKQSDSNYPLDPLRALY